VNPLPVHPRLLHFNLIDLVGGNFAGVLSQNYEIGQFADLKTADLSF
jgi:hypothetical protein